MTEVSDTAVTFTPGPWAVKTKGDDSRYIMANNGGGPFVARLVHSARDASLIAAAPELYEAAKEALLRCSMSDSMRRQLHAALAKARGQ